MRKFRLWLFLLAVLPALAEQPGIQVVLQPRQERKAAPGFTLQDAMGKTATLADYRGKVLLLDFWATWCGGCKKEIPWFVEFENKYRASGLETVGVSLDEEGWDVLRPFLKEHPIPYRIVWGNSVGDNPIAKRYAIEGMPDTFLIDKEGRIAAAYRAGVVDRADMAANIEKLVAEPAPAQAQSQLLDRELASQSFKGNKVGTNPVRKMVVYLPDGYAAGTKRYPVIYFLATGFENYRAAFDRHGARALFDAAISTGAIDPFILVSADMNTAVGSSWYVNSTATGNWEDFLTQELVSYVDTNFRTLPNRNTRGLLGEGMGGYGAIRVGMRHPDVFGSVYALHPVGTGSGMQTMFSRPNWDLMAKARSADDLKNEGLSMVFLSIFQAHLPNPDKPPLFIDLAAHNAGDQLAVDSQLTERLHASFFLERMIPQYADNLKSLRGFQFDWGRGDVNKDHVFSNQAFTHKLDEFGVPHEAEEFRGGWGDRNWGEDGRVNTAVLPFFRKHLAPVSGQ